MLRRCSKISFPYEHITNGTENSVALLTSTEKSGQPWLLLLLHYHGNTTLIWKTYFGTAPNVLRGREASGAPNEHSRPKMRLQTACRGVIQPASTRFASGPASPYGPSRG